MRAPGPACPCRAPCKPWWAAVREPWLPSRAQMGWNGCSRWLTFLGLDGSCWRACRPPRSLPRPTAPSAGAWFRRWVCWGLRSCWPGAWASASCGLSTRCTPPPRRWRLDTPRPVWNWVQAHASYMRWPRNSTACSTAANACWRIWPRARHGFARSRICRPTGTGSRMRSTASCASTAVSSKARGCPNRPFWTGALGAAGPQPHRTGLAGAPCLAGCAQTLP